MTKTIEPTKRNLALALGLVPILVFSGIVGLFLFALNSGDPSKLPSALIGKKVPATKFSALVGLKKDGVQVPRFETGNLANGKVSVVNFWASWCGPCITEHPQIVTIGKLADINLYGVNYKDTSKAALRFLNKHGNPFEALGVDPTGRGAIEWGIVAMPETFIVNQTGEIIFKHTGPITKQILKAKILPIIQAAKAD